MAFREDCAFGEKECLKVSHLGKSTPRVNPVVLRSLADASLDANSGRNLRMLGFKRHIGDVTAESEVKTRARPVRNA